MTNEELIKSLRTLIEEWRHRTSITEDCYYDFGCNDTTDALADELEDVLNKFQKQWKTCHQYKEDDIVTHEGEKKKIKPVDAF